MVSFETYFRVVSSVQHPYTLPNFLTYFIFFNEIELKFALKSLCCSVFGGKTEKYGRKFGNVTCNYTNSCRICQMSPMFEAPYKFKFLGYVFTGDLYLFLDYLVPF